MAKKIRNEKGLSGPAVAIVGNLSDGFRVVGPFGTFDDASTYCDANGLGSIDSWIATIWEPGEFAAFHNSQ